MYAILRHIKLQYYRRFYVAWLFLGLLLLDSRKNHYNQKVFLSCYILIAFLKARLKKEKDGETRRRKILKMFNT
jgi:hypothetical protein